MESVFGKNQSVADALDAYLQLERPQFAALIDSPWGSGKTWFIRKYFEEKRKKMDSLAEREINKNKEKPVFCYVSLFDISDAKEIDSSIIAQANPLFNSKNIKRWGRLARFAVEKTINYLPIEDPEKVTDIISTTVHQLCAQRPDSLVVCLDDIERTKMSMEVILGYISSLLEDADAKVIILSNTKEIIHDKDIFCKFKEKVIGLNISLYDDFESVFKNVMGLANSGDVKEILEKYKEIIFHVYNVSLTRNLRHIRRFIFEFSSLYKEIPDKIQEDEKFIADVIKYLFSISIELHSNKDVKSFFNEKMEQWPWINMIREGNPLDKYGLSSNGLFHPKFWCEFIENGKLDREFIFEYYNSSQYTNAQTRPIPIQLWSFREMDDDEFEHLYKKMIEELKGNKYTDPGILLHAYAELITFSLEKIKEIDIEEIITNVRDYCNNAKFIKIDSKDRLFLSSTYSSGFLQFHSFDSKEFREVYEIVKQSYIDFINKDIERRYGNIFEENGNTFEEFIKLEIFISDDIELKNMILYNNNFSKIAHILCTFTNKNIQEVSSVIVDILQKGYSFLDGVHIDKQKLKKWIIGFCLSLKKQSKDMPPLARNSISMLIHRLKKIVE